MNVTQLEALLKQGGSLSHEMIVSSSPLAVNQLWLDNVTPRRIFKIIKLELQTLIVAEGWQTNTTSYDIRLINRYLFEEDIAQGELVIWK